MIDIGDLADIDAASFEANVTIRQAGDDVEVQIGDAALTLNGVSERGQRGRHRRRRFLLV